MEFSTEKTFSEKPLSFYQLTQVINEFPNLSPGKEELIRQLGMGFIRRELDKAYRLIQLNTSGFILKLTLKFKKPFYLKKKKKLRYRVGENPYKKIDRS